MEHNNAVRTITVVCESFTTKTCSRCGYINHNVGSSDDYHCPHCGIIDRDTNGARCILIKARSGQSLNT